jgi:predicted metal-dependent phosphoesterase TrpH
MTGSHHLRIRSRSPRLPRIREKGYIPVDMHIHTHYSDAAIRVPLLLSRAKRLGIGIAITDHNEIKGVTEAYSHTRDTLVIPGIELSSREGPHILLYFYSPRDLADFFTTHIRADRGRSQYVATHLPVEKILMSAEKYSCVKVAAHPFGYFGLNRGLLKCIDNKTLPADIISHVDGIEVICGGMARDLNNKAITYAGEHDFPITGGSDSHVLSSVGSVITGVKADTVDAFLDGILAKKSIVIGSTAKPLHKGMAAAVIAWNYIPYTVSSLHVHYEQNIHRVKGYLNDFLK